MEETSHSNANSKESKSKPSSSVVKRIASVFRSVVKSKSLFSIFDKISLFSKKIQYSNTLAALVRSRHSTKIHMVGGQNEQQYLIDDYGDYRGEAEEENNKNENDFRYPDLTHSLFEDEEEEGDDPNASVIDIVMNKKAADEKIGGDGEFKLEDEIDRVADLFITRFHKQLRIQKLDSFKRYQEMLNRSV